MNRFLEDFMFQLNDSETDWLVSQNVIPHKKYFGGSLPYAFTEQGIAMLSSILHSEMYYVIYSNHVRIMNQIALYVDFLCFIAVFSNRYEKPIN